MGAPLIYRRVMALAGARGWKTDLRVEDELWILRVLDGGDLIASARSRRPMPECFEVLGEKALSDLKGGARL